MKILIPFESKYKNIIDKHNDMLSLKKKNNRIFKKISMALINKK